MTQNENPTLDFSALSKEEFRAVWRVTLAMFPGLHPDEVYADDGGWDESPVLHSIGKEARRRREKGEFSYEDLFDVEAQRAGLEGDCGP